MVTCPKCKAQNDWITVMHRKTEPGVTTGMIADIKEVTTEIKRKCAKCGHTWTTNPHKNWRWIYGTRIERWVLVPPTDRDWGIWGVPQAEFKKMGKEEALATQTGARALRGKSSPARKKTAEKEMFVAHNRALLARWKRMSPAEQSKYRLVIP